VKHISQILAFFAVLIYSQSYIFVGWQYKELFFDGAVVVVYFSIVVLSDNKVWKIVNMIILDCLAWNFNSNTICVDEWMIWSKGVIVGMVFIFNFLCIKKVFHEYF
jgi:hypothetical protein